MLPVYNLSIDECDAENGEYLGVLEIANTANPAIMIKGIALSDIKQMIFKDDLKYRIASPVLIPSKIYRRDETTGEEYYVNVTPEIVEQMFVKFQKDRSGKDVFNDEHDEAKRVPSYILETWLVETPKTDKSLVTYGIECPEKTWFAVQQFTDKQAYFDCVDSGKIGFSIHGESALKFSKQTLKNYSDVIVLDGDKCLLLERTANDTFEPLKYGFAGGKIEDGEEPIVSAIRELNEETGLNISKMHPVENITNDDGSVTHYFVANVNGEVQLSDEHKSFSFLSCEEIKNIDVIMGQNQRFIDIINKSKEIIKPINMSKKRKFVAQFTEAIGTDTGEVIVTADSIEVGQAVTVLDEDLQPIETFSGNVTIDDQPITITDNVIEAVGTEVEMTEEVEEVAEVEMAVEEVVEEVEMAEETPAVETYTKAEVDAKFDEIYSMIAELKVADVATVEEVEMKQEKTPEQLRMAKIEQLSKFLNKK
jgi:8-oxo-dGTP pyrophosphatase MutT (NUDIX family)